MSTLAEIETAAQGLPPEQQRELIRFLAQRLRRVDEPARKARLVKGPDGTLLLAAPPDAPPMTTATVNELLRDFP